MKIIQYISGKWSSDMTFIFSKVINDDIIRFERSRGFLSQFERDFNYNVIIEEEKDEN